jgi:hypothetical protein
VPNAYRKGWPCLKQIGWFVLLWLIGVFGFMLLALPFRLLVLIAGGH